MKDKLENFVDQNRDLFEQFEPSADIWKGIEKNITDNEITRRFNWKNWLSKAAMIALIFATSVVAVEMFHRIYDPEQKIGGMDKTPEIPELKEAEMYYSAKLNEKLEEAKPIFTKNPELGTEMGRDLSDLDSLYNDLKKNLKDNISNEEVIEALIQNYRMRIEILEDILDEFKDDSSDKYEQNNTFTNEI